MVYIPAGLRRGATNGLLALVSSALALLLGEAVARFVEPPPTPYTGHGLFAADAELGHVLRPGAGRDDIRTNSLGLRDVEYAEQKPEGAYRVLGLGDSFTFGGRWPEEVYLERLERRLDRRGRRVEVLNAGVPAYSTLQEAGLLRRLGPRVRPDLVVLGLFVTGDVIENHSDEHLQVIDGELSARPVGRLERQLLRSRLYRLLRARTVHAAGDPRLDGRYLATEWDRLQVCARRPLGHVRHGFDVTGQALADLREVVASLPSRLVVLLVPDEVQVDPTLLPLVLGDHPVSPADFDLELPQRRLAQRLETLGVPFVDVLPDCRREHLTAPVYRRGDTHWNDRGHALAARALHDWMRAQRIP